VPNFIEIDLFNFELYRFKVGAFFETRRRCPCSDESERLPRYCAYMYVHSTHPKFALVVGNWSACGWLVGRLVYVNGRLNQHETHGSYRRSRQKLLSHHAASQRV